MIFAHDNVQLFFISPDGTVTSSSEPERMLIVQFSGKTILKTPFYLVFSKWCTIF